MQIKITFNNETKKLRKTNDYQSFLASARKAFPELPAEFKFFYVDSDGDTISIGNEDDFNECMEYCQDAGLTNLKLLIAKTVDDAQAKFEAWSSENNDSVKPQFTPSMMQKQDNFGNNFMGQNFSDLRYFEDYPEK